MRDHKLEKSFWGWTNFIFWRFTIMKMNQDWIVLKECFKAGIGWRWFIHSFPERKTHYHFTMLKSWMFWKQKQWKHDDLKEVVCDLIGRTKILLKDEFDRWRPLERFQWFWSGDAEFRKSRIWTEAVIMLENYKLFGKVE